MPLFCTSLSFKTSWQSWNESSALASTAQESSVEFTSLSSVSCKGPAASSRTEGWSPGTCIAILQSTYILCSDMENDFLTAGVCRSLKVRKKQNKTKQKKPKTNSPDFSIKKTAVCTCGIWKLLKQDFTSLFTDSILQKKLIWVAESEFTCLCLPGNALVPDIIQKLQFMILHDFVIP